MKNRKIKTNKTRIIALILLLCTVTLMFSSCGSEKIEKPEDTNLEYWLLDKLDTDSCTELYTTSSYYIGTFLPKEYKATIDENGNLVAPSQVVTYTLLNYPYTDFGAPKISRIDITDPNVYVWGLTINSTRKEIISTMKDRGFEIYDDRPGISITFRLPNEDTLEIHFMHGKSIYISLYVPTFGHHFI